MNVRRRAISLAATGTALGASLLAYPFLPRRVATHFRWDGRPDRHTGRGVATLRTPALMAGIAILNQRLGAWPGGSDREDTESGVQALGEAIDVAELGLLLNHVALLANGLSLPMDMQRVPRAICGVLLIALGNVLPKLPRNPIVGIRTPWTLAHPAVWERTHRLAGYLCVLAGLATLAAVPARGRVATRVPVLASLASASIAAAYSWVVYRQRSRPVGLQK